MARAFALRCVRGKREPTPNPSRKREGRCQMVNLPLNGARYFALRNALYLAAAPRDNVFNPLPFARRKIIGTGDETCQNPGCWRA